MASTIVTPDQDAIVSEIHIAAPPERVFQSLIDPKQVTQWWTGAECPIESFAMEAKRGGRWHYDSKEGTVSVNGVTKFHCDGEVLEYDLRGFYPIHGLATGKTIPNGAPSCVGNLRLAPTAPT